MPINPNAAGIKRKHNDISYTANNSSVNHVTDESLPARIAYQELAARLRRLEEVMLNDDHKFPDGSLQSIIFNCLKATTNNITEEQNNSNNSNSGIDSNGYNINGDGLIDFVQCCVQGLTNQLNQFPDDKTIQHDGGKLRDYLEDFLTWQASLTNGFPVDIHTYHKILSYVESEVEATALSLTCKAHYLNTKAHRLPSHLQRLKTPVRDYASPPVGCKNLRVHDGGVACLTTLPNGFIVSGSYDGTLKIWNPKTGECVRSLEGHEDSFSCLTTLPNGCIVSEFTNELLKIWNPETGECINTLQGHEGPIYCLTTLPNGCIVSGSYDKTLKIWSPGTGECVRTLEGHKEEVYCLTTLPNGFIVSGSEDKTLKIWNPNTGECVNTLEGHKREVECLTTLPNGFIASGSRDNTLKIWNPNTGECVNTLKGHEDWVHCLTTLPNGCIVSGSHDETIKIWSFERLMPKHDAKNVDSNVTRSQRQFLLGTSNSANNNASNNSSANANINVPTSYTNDNASSSNYFKRGQP